jgi:hypothetical protein
MILIRVLCLNQIVLCCLDSSNSMRVWIVIKPTYSHASRNGYLWGIIAPVNNRFVQRQREVVSSKMVDVFSDGNGSLYCWWYAKTCSSIWVSGIRRDKDIIRKGRNTFCILSLYNFRAFLIFFYTFALSYVSKLPKEWFLFLFVSLPFKILFCNLLIMVDNNVSPLLNTLNLLIYFLLT